MRELPKTGDVYRHFKGKRYVIIGYVINATNDTDSRPMVLYIDEDKLDERSRQYFCRSLEEFLSPVDKNKHPYTTQHWRFQKVQ